MNRDGGGKPRSSRAGRQITEEEAELWHQVGRSLDKVKKKPRVTPHGDAAEGEAPARSGTPAPTRPRSEPRAKTPPAVPPSPAPVPSRPPAPAEIDRRTHRQVAAGKLAIDDVLDLHGLNQETAHRRLRSFLMSCQARGHRMVLVVTGKGGPGRADAQFGERPGDGSRRGVLRRIVPLWLEEPELRAIVLGYGSAGVRHGGEGALYIRLRKAREA
jgi:DNA-nicking Smr family endonuclease